MTDPRGHGVIDWGLAARLGRRLAGEESSQLDLATVRTASSEALAMALAYTTLEPASPVPVVEVVSRAEWIESNLEELPRLMSPVEERMGGELDLPGPFGAVARKALGAAAGAEAGAVVGYAAKRVLGQYQVSPSIRSRRASHAARRSESGGGRRKARR